MESLEVGKACSCVLTSWVRPDKGAIILLLGHEHAIIQHVHVGSGSQNGTCGSLLTLRQNEIRNSSFCVIMAPVVLLVPVGVFDSIVGRGVEVVLHAFVSRDLVCTYTVKQLILLAYREAVRVHPGTPDAMERFVQVLLIVLTALNEADIG